MWQMCSPVMEGGYDEGQGQVKAHDLHYLT